LFEKLECHEEQSICAVYFARLVRSRDTILHRSSCDPSNLQV
jgi:hypothetical protein